MVITPSSVCSGSMNGASASNKAQDDGLINPLCEAHSNDCRTGCFVMRKIIAHVFGRNKACTSQIPDHCWVEWCRKHYQRLRHRMLDQGWIFLQIKCLRTQLGRMEEWGEVQSFTIVLQRRFQEELNGKDSAKASEDEVGLMDSPDITTMSKDDHAKEHTKASSNSFLYPFLGMEKSFDDVYAVIDAIEKAANEGQLIFLPPLQFLPFIDATLHPPPPIARPRNQRMSMVHQKISFDQIPEDDSHLETLVDSDTSKNIDSSSSSYSSPALKLASSHKIYMDQIAAELASRPFSTLTMVPELKNQYDLIPNDDAAAQKIAPDSTGSEVASDNPSPVARPLSSLNGTKNQVGVGENEIDEAFEKDLAALVANSITKNKQSDVRGNLNADSATKKSAGVTRLFSSKVEKTDNSRKTPAHAPHSPKIQALPPGSIPVVDTEYGFIGYQTAMAKLDKAGTLSAKRPHFRSRVLRQNAATLEPTEASSKNTPIQYNPYPREPSRTYQSVLNDTNGQVETSTTDKCKDSGMETRNEQIYSLEKHSVQNEHKGTDTPVFYDGNPITSIPRMGFNSWMPVNASTVTTFSPISVRTMANNTNYQDPLTLDWDTSTKIANSERFASAPSPSIGGDANTDPSSFGTSTRSIAHSALEPLSGIPPLSGSEKRRRDDAEEGQSLLEGQSLGKRQMG